MTHRKRKFHPFFNRFLCSVADTQNAEISGIHGGVVPLTIPMSATQKPGIPGFCGAKWTLLYLAPSGNNARCGGAKRQPDGRCARPEAGREHAQHSIESMSKRRSAFVEETPIQAEE
jgi:hypothetical protein